MIVLLLLASIDLAACMQNNFRVVGGGLAGLGVTYHLLRCAKQPIRVQVVDQSHIGQGGASAVAGGLIHPLSPRGKLVHWGLEGLHTTNKLVEQACRFNDRVIVREELFRIATDERQSQALQDTASKLAALATWLPRDQLLDEIAHDQASPVTIKGKGIYGGIRLSNGCKVIHVPSYLEGLWQVCRNLAKESHSSLSWTQQDGFKATFDDDDDDESSVTSILCAGASGLREIERAFGKSLPAQLVRGHSVELNGSIDHAVLSGKYVSPTTCGRTLIGATHEFKLNDERTPSQIVEELQQRTAHMCHWDASEVLRITSGVRVQSSRGANGRMPIVGRVRSNTWIFTGLSSRGLLYHGIYGEILAKAILRDNENFDCPDILWWKK